MSCWRSPDDSQVGLILSYLITFIDRFLMTFEAIFFDAFFTYFVSEYKNTDPVLQKC